MSDFEKQVLANKRKIVWREIKKYLDDSIVFSGQRQIPKRYSSLLKFHQRLINEYPKRFGKYVRPTIILLICEAMGGKTDNALKTAAAMQLSEEWLLIHDDFEDDSLYRRGQPALQRIYGPELAVNAGDTLHLIQNQLLLDNFINLPSKLARKVADEFTRMLLRTAIGQTVEIKWTQETNTSLKEEDYLFIIDGKTVDYSVAGPMRLGAILAGASDVQLEELYAFGRPLGRCYQIRDDYLDLVSDFDGLKQKGNDVYEGKITVFLIHLLQNIKSGDRAKLLSILAKSRAEKTSPEVEWVILMMEKHGSLQYGKSLAEGFAKEAKERMSKLSFLKYRPAKNQLHDLIDFVIERTH